MLPFLPFVQSTIKLRPILTLFGNRNQNEISSKKINTISWITSKLNRPKRW